MRIRNHTGKHQSFGTVHIPYGGWLEVGPDSMVATTGYRRGTVDLQLTPNDTLRRDIVHWKSPFSLADGYATAAEQMCLALDMLGVPLHMEPCWFDENEGLQEWTIGKLKEDFPGFMDVGICMATAGEFKLLPTRYRIGYTMYESDNPLERYPEWRHDCDRADMLVVPSNYCRDVFSKFFKRDIIVAPLVTSATYHFPKKREATDTFTFVSYGTLSDRKSPLETIDCFQKAFPDRKDVRLVLKTRFGVCGYSYHQIPPIDDERVTVISTGRNQQNPKGDWDWSAAQMRDWLYKADCMLFLSKGEGYGLPPREGLATGIPLIYAYNTGMEDIDGGYPIRTHHVEQSPIGGYWRVPDWDQAIDRMRWVVEHRDEAYRQGYDDGVRQALHRIDGAKVLRDLVADVSGHSVRKPTLPVIEDAKDHAEFYDIIETMAKGPILDIGGNATIPLKKRGLDVYAVCPPDAYPAVCERIAAAGLPVRVQAANLAQLSKMTVDKEISLCVSQGLFQEYHVEEIRLIVNAALSIAPLVFSVPSVNYPQQYSEFARMGWRRQWEDMLNGYRKDLRFYNKKRYIMALVNGYGMPVDKLNGWQTRDGVWRAADDTDD